MKFKFVFVGMIVAILLFHSSLVFSHELGDRKQKIKQGILPSLCLCCGHIRNPCRPETKKKYSQFYGPMYTHIHHFCWGMDKKNNALMEQNLNKKNVWLKSALGEFNYVLARRNQDTNRKLIPMVYTEKAILLLMLDQKKEAITSFQSAIAFNKHYIKAYLYLADFFKKEGDTINACQIINNAIKANPTNKKLIPYRSQYCGQ